MIRNLSQSFFRILYNINRKFPIETFFEASEVVVSSQWCSIKNVFLKISQKFLKSAKS